MRPHRAIWGDRIRAARLAAGLTQVELAAAAGVDQRYITKWENGRAAPTDKNRHRLAQALGIPAGDLFAWPDPDSNGDTQAA